MRILNESTLVEIKEPDLTCGELRECDWAPPEAYEAAAKAGLPALPDDAYERVLMYHVWTPSEEAAHAAAAKQADELTRLKLAVAELGAMVAGGVA